MEAPSDPLAIRPLTEAGGKVVETALELLRDLFKPVAVQAGEELADGIARRRQLNSIKFALRLQETVDRVGRRTKSNIHPRIAVKILNEASDTDDENVQSMWAGLFVAGCNGENPDEKDLIFVSRLAQITPPQARLLKYACENGVVKVARSGWIGVERLMVHVDTIKAITGEDDLQALDYQIDHLVSLLLMRVGLRERDYPNGNITPSCMALNMYVRCLGETVPPVDYFKRIGRLK